MQFFVGLCTAQSIPYPVLSQDWAIPTSPTTYGVTKTIGINGSSPTDYAALTYYEYFNPDSNRMIGYFAFNYQGGSTVTFELPKNVYVTDFVQLESFDHVAFCGIVNNSQTAPNFDGVVGYFDINSSTTLVQYYYKVFPSIDKFVAVSIYENTSTGDVDIVAIGKVNGSNDKIIYSNNLISNPNEYDVDINQKLWNIVKTENYLVFVGYDRKHPGICLRKELYSQMGSPTLLNTVYDYILPNDEPSTMTHSVYLGNDMNKKGDLIAVSTPTFVSDSYTDSRYRFFDISTMQMVNAQRFTVPAKTDTYGMAYLEDSGILASLVNSDATSVIPTSYSSVVMMKPFNTSAYLADYIYNPARHYLSIDNLNQSPTSVEHMLMHSIETNEISWFMRNPSINPPFPCISSALTEVNPIKTVPYQSYMDILTPTPPVYYSDSQDKAINHCTIINQCP